MVRLAGVVGAGARMTPGYLGCSGIWLRRGIRRICCGLCRITDADERHHAAGDQQDCNDEYHSREAQRVELSTCDNTEQRNRNEASDTSNRVVDG